MPGAKHTQDENQRALLEGIHAVNNLPISDLPGFFFHGTHHMLPLESGHASTRFEPMMNFLVNLQLWID
jgi:hypothetical protein